MWQGGRKTKVERILINHKPTLQKLIKYMLVMGNTRSSIIPQLTGDFKVNLSGVLEVAKQFGWGDASRNLLIAVIFPEGNFESCV